MFADTMISRRERSSAHAQKNGVSRLGCLVREIGKVGAIFPDQHVERVDVEPTIDRRPVPADAGRAPLDDSECRTEA